MPKKHTHQEFIELVNKKYGNSLDLSNCLYEGRAKKVLVRCIKHNNSYETWAQYLLNKNTLGNGCCKCKSEKLSSLKCITKEEFLERVSKHYIKCNYNYSLLELSNGRKSKKIKVVCPKHGIFTPNANDHLDGRAGCPLCSNNRKKTLEEVIIKFKNVHGDRYDYSNFILMGMKIKSEIICKIHGSFFQSAQVHQKGCNCPQCVAESYISKKEKIWLNDIIKIPNDGKHRQVKFYLNNRFILVDGYDPLTNTIYEFYGDYWHGNPVKYAPNIINKSSNKTMKELYDYTLLKEKLIKDSGFKLITIWESEYDKIVNL